MRRLYVKISHQELAFLWRGGRISIDQIIVIMVIALLSTLLGIVWQLSVLESLPPQPTPGLRIAQEKITELQTR